MSSPTSCNPFNIVSAVPASPKNHSPFHAPFPIDTSLVPVPSPSSRPDSMISDMTPLPSPVSTVSPVFSDISSSSTASSASVSPRVRHPSPSSSIDPFSAWPSFIQLNDPDIETPLYRASSTTSSSFDPTTRAASDSPIPSARSNYQASHTNSSSPATNASSSSAEIIFHAISSAADRANPTATSSSPAMKRRCTEHLFRKLNETIGLGDSDIMMEVSRLVDGIGGEGDGDGDSDSAVGDIDKGVESDCVQSSTGLVGCNYWTGEGVDIQPATVGVDQVSSRATS